MRETPKPLIASVVRSLCGLDVERCLRITSGGRHETYRAECVGHAPVVVRIARCGEPWFLDEAYLMSLAREHDVPTPDVYGVEHLEHDGELLSFSVLARVPGRSLAELAGELDAKELARLLLDAGELLARIHSVETDRGIHHHLQPPSDEAVERAVETAHQSLGPEAAVIVERGARRQRELLAARDAPAVTLAHGDFLPKHLMIDRGAIVGVIDWEFAGPASPAFDLARWGLSARAPLHRQADLLRRGYARVADLEAAWDGWIPAFAIDWALTVLSWKNPASLTRIQRCVERIAECCPG